MTKPSGKSWSSWIGVNARLASFGRVGLQSLLPDLYTASKAQPQPAHRLRRGKNIAELFPDHRKP